LVVAVCEGVVESVHQAFASLFPIELLEQVLRDARRRGIVLEKARLNGGTVLHFLASLLDVNIVVAVKTKQRTTTSAVKSSATSDDKNEGQRGVASAYKRVKCYLSEASQKSGENDGGGDEGARTCSVGRSASAPFIVVEALNVEALNAEVSARVASHGETASSCYRLLKFGGKPFLSFKQVVQWLEVVGAQCSSQCPHKFAPGVMQQYRNWLAERVSRGLKRG
jgi:hypothetical protein